MNRLGRNHVVFTLIARRTGKTMLARAIGREHGHFVTLRGHAAQREAFGDSAKVRGSAEIPVIEMHSVVPYANG